MSARIHQSYVVGNKTYWREASVVMACHGYNASCPRTDDYWFNASWQPKWWGGKVLTIRENFAVKEEGA
jgi:hypothetical protein